MDAIALRMEGPLARALNRIRPGLRIAITNEDKPEQLGALFRLHAAEVLLIGYEPTRHDQRSAFEILIACDSDPLMSAMPVAMAFQERHAGAFDDDVRRMPQWLPRILPISERDFLHPALPSLVKRHIARHRKAVEHARLHENFSGSGWEEMSFPWECP